MKKNKLKTTNIYFLISKIFQGHKNNLIYEHIYATPKIIKLIEFFFKNGFLTSLTFEKVNDVNCYKIFYNRKFGSETYTQLMFISKPSDRCQVSVLKIKKFLNHKKYHSCIGLVSTSKGYLTFAECLEKNIGGELICIIF
jgi:ribosomal protein S8